jgi:uncharacterized protein YaaR (DUF327 family)|tara:strand:- start:454 stop:669 length:216 start_codon:yes stop_codon:yes gene_type:complete
MSIDNRISKSERKKEVKRKWRELCEKMEKDSESSSIIAPENVEKFYERIDELGRQRARAYAGAKTYFVSAA